MTRLTRKGVKFRLQYNDQARGTLGSLVAMPSLLSRVIKSQGQDAEILSIKDRVQSCTSDEGWAIHTDGSLWYRGRVVVPQLTDLREDIFRTALNSLCIQAAQRCTVIFIASITGAE